MANISSGFKPSDGPVHKCSANQSIFIENTTRGKVILALYADDIILNASDSEGIQKTKEKIYMGLSHPKGRALGRGLLYKNHGHFNIEGFSNADWTGSPDDRKSTSGFYTMV
ncbi:uncharacterized protein [Aristolochia californica]|uniref:uncharacterized protein n=1 Tax=Aristolochia californica TaxID=171875 RepID=UPI0035DE8B5A